MSTDPEDSARQSQATAAEGKAEEDLLWRYLKEVPAFRALLRAVESRFYQHLELPTPILDLGCGDGVFGKLTFDKKLDVGIDPWWRPLLKARATGAYVGVVQGLGQALPFPDRCFKTVISNSVLEHVADVQPVLEETSRVLDDGGLFVLTVPSHYFTAKLWGAQILERMRLNPLADLYRTLFNRIARHAHVDPPEGWVQRLAKAGFRVERWQYYFSESSLHALELGHIQGIPSALIHALTGHWIVAPWSSNLRTTEKWVRPYYQETDPEAGSMILFVVRKHSSGPLAPVLPAPSTIDVIESAGLSAGPSLAEVEDTSGKDLKTDEADAEDNIQSASWSELIVRRLTHDYLRMFLVVAAVAVTFITLLSLRNEGTNPSSGIPWIAAAIILLALAKRPVILTGFVGSLRHNISRAPTRRWLILPAFLMALLANNLVNNQANMQRPLLALFCWLSAIALGTFAFWDPRRTLFSPFLSYPRQRWELPALAAVLLFALIVRLVDITSHPFILSGSEASIGLDGWAVAQGGIQNPFASAWLTNPTLPLYPLAVPLTLFGRTILGIRILSPLIGTATVAVIFFVGRRMWGPAVGLIAALLLAGSHLHVHYSRIGMTNIWDPLLALSAVGVIYTAWASRKRLTWIAAGIVTGLNAYFYTTSHLMPIILLGIFLYFLIDRDELREQRSSIFAFSILTLLVAFPQMLYYRSYPSIYFDRLNALGIFQSGWILNESAASGIAPYDVIIRQFWNGFLSFVSGVDQSTSYNPGVPLLGISSAVMFVVGSGLAIWRIKQTRYAILLIWIVVVLIFGAALLERPPNSHRLLMGLPAAVLLISVAVIWLFYQLLSAASGLRRFLIPIALIFSLLLVLGDLRFYFGDYRSQHRFGDRNTEIAFQVAQYLDSLDGSWNAFFYGAPSMYINFPTFNYLLDDAGENIRLIEVEDPGSAPAVMPGTNAIFIFVPERSEELNKIEDLYPGGDLFILPGYHANPLSYLYQLES